MNKYIILIIVLFFGTFCTAQVAIGKTVVSNGSVLLEFGSENKGIVLPSSSVNPVDAVPGTFIVNSSSSTVNVLEGNTWKNLIEGGSFVANPFINAGGDVGKGTVIGASTTVKPGVLVLESSNKSLVLPYVANPHLTLGSNASVGTMVYDTISDSLAVFDGLNWHYWQ